MNKIVECVPNFSEGRDEAKVGLIINAIASVPEIFVLDHDIDADHNRTVITFIGEPQAVVEASLRGAATALELIDLNHHKGAHPRFGALDVLPFIPIKGISMGECVKLARHAGERLARELRIPVYLYEKAATRMDRIDLADVRRGEFEGLRDEIGTNPDRKPDFGETRIHLTGGAIAVGARSMLIAYNINLGTGDLTIAKKVAKAVRGRDGGLKYVKALGMQLKNRNQVQVSMNLVNYQATPIYRVYEMVKMEAVRYGVAIAGSKIVGLVPQAALNSCIEFFLQIENFNDDSIFEHRMRSEMAKQDGVVELTPQPEYPHDLAAEIAPSPTIDEFVDEVSDATLAPDGGTVAAYAGALAAALATLVCNLTIGQHTPAAAEVRAILKQIEQLSADLRLAVSEETEGRARILDALDLRRETEGEKLARAIAVEDAAKNALAVPLRVAQSSLEVLEWLSVLAEIGNPAAFPNIATGAQLAMAAIRGAVYNVLSQLTSINDEDFNRSQRSELSDLINRGKEMADEIEMLFFRLYPK
ncbi:MAG: glutamate formimidoyltransferase [Acidobacteria bacterium]|nr:glutamate formimidoyltransferase [Acidobacteriota bacterium]